MKKSKKLEEEYFVIVDENDKVIGKAERSMVFKKRLIFRGLRAIITNPKGEFLFLKRAKQKRIFPDCWELGVGGGLQYGETPAVAIKREVEEELGIKNVELKYFDKKYIENPTERLFTYIFMTTHDGKFILQKSEVADTKFVSRKDIDKFLKNKKIHNPSIDMFKEMLNKGVF